MHRIKCDSASNDMITYEANDGTSDIATMDAVLAENEASNAPSINATSVGLPGQNVNLPTSQKSDLQPFESRCI